MTSLKPRPAAAARAESSSATEGVWTGRSITLGSTAGMRS